MFDFLLVYFIIVFGILIRVCNFNIIRYFIILDRYFMLIFLNLCNVDYILIKGKKFYKKCDY